MNKEQLLARAQELQIEVPEGATNPEIINLIKIAEHPLLSAKLKNAEKLNEDAMTQLQTANETIEVLEAKLAGSPEKVKGATFKSEAGTFEFKVKTFRFKGEKYSAEDAVQNTELMEALIESNSNLLKQV